MHPDPSNPSRITRPGVSTVLIVGLLIGATVAALRPATAPLSRDGAAQRLATRQLAQSLARAVRELAASDRDKPAITWARPVWLSSPALERVAVSDEVGLLNVRLLRECMLALPPPVA